MHATSFISLIPQGSSKDSLVTLQKAGKLSETPAHIMLLKIQW